MAMRRTILFLCPSVLAAAYCQQLAAQHGLDIHVTSAGTEPDAAVLPSVMELLRSEGIDVAHYTPRQVTPAELGTAFRVISLGCDVTAMTPPGTPVEHWDDVPSPSTQLARARQVIYAHVEQLMRDLQAVVD
jgi:protein-tyrosine-phosphatase